MDTDQVKDYYVLLTGGKNNAGDFLIKYRAKKLLEGLRPDRKFIDYNAWELLDEEKLEVINEAKALLLTGGPALRENMYPGIYQLTKNLDDIKVPIILMGIGWKASRGDWQDTYNYNFSHKTKQLLEKILSTPFYSSVRDYHSMQVLNNHGFEKVLMTGCPALYDLENINSSFQTGNEINTILFSAGATQSESKITDQNQKEIILFLKDFCKRKNFKVVFHHSIDPSYLKTHNPNEELYYKNNELADWLVKKNISYVDISGSANDLIKEYSQADLHVGYRVHAHIFMSSISKPSFLITEDGRGTALKELLPGSVIDGYKDLRNDFLNKIYRKVGILNEKYVEQENLLDLLKKKMLWEITYNYPRISMSRSSIDRHYQIMKQYINQLP